MGALIRLRRQHSLRSMFAPSITWSALAAMWVPSNLNEVSCDTGRRKRTYDATVSHDPKLAFPVGETLLLDRICGNGVRKQSVSMLSMGS